MLECAVMLLRLSLQVLGQKLEFANAPLWLEKKQTYLANKIAERKAKGVKVRSRPLPGSGFAAGHLRMSTKGAAMAQASELLDLLQCCTCGAVVSCACTACPLAVRVVLFSRVAPGRASVLHALLQCLWCHCLAVRVVPLLAGLLQAK